MATKVNQIPASNGAVQYHVTDSGSNLTKIIKLPKESVSFLTRNIDNNQTTQSAINTYLNENSQKSSHDLQLGVDAILLQAKSFQNSNGKILLRTGVGTGEVIEQQYSSLENFDVNGKGTVPVSESVNIINLTKQSDARSISQVLGVSETDHKFSPEDNAANKIRFKEGVPHLNASIGGSDLSVFYLTEAPVMEDVMDSSLTPDMWRKEIITFELDNVLSLSYSTIRAKFPVRTMGRSNPKAYTYGPRTIAGHLTFAVMAEDIISRLRARIYNAFKQNSSLLEQSISNKSLMKQDTDKSYMQAKIHTYWDMAIKLSGVELLDSLPEFDILVMGINEYGVFSRFMIRQVSIIDENQYMGTTQPNIMNKITFTALDLVPMASFNYNSGGVVSSLGTSIENIRDIGFGGLTLRSLSASDLLSEFDGDGEIDMKSIARLEG